MVCMLCKRKVAIMPKDTANEGSVDKQKWICGNIKQSCQSCRYCGVQFCAKNMARSLRGTLLELGHEARMIKEVYEKFGMPGTTNGVNTDSLVMCDRCGANLSRLVVKTSKKQDEASSNAAEHTVPLGTSKCSLIGRPTPCLMLRARVHALGARCIR